MFPSKRVRQLSKYRMKVFGFCLILFWTSNNSCANWRQSMFFNFSARLSLMMKINNLTLLKLASWPYLALVEEGNHVGQPRQQKVRSHIIVRLSVSRRRFQYVFDQAQSSYFCVTSWAHHRRLAKLLQLLELPTSHHNLSLQKCCHPIGSISRSYLCMCSYLTQYD